MRSGIKKEGRELNERYERQIKKGVLEMLVLKLLEDEENLKVAGLYMR